ncbi:uncharacterized protein VTP21DRAFT_11063 [Calcarisporiella thermophila]|uniref:uncharacterized protein n=1 Tax=Calcarisporiella thermophila TaxID=911321 RepID=UPI0037425494
MEVHVNQCLDGIKCKSLCEICGKDISIYNCSQREQHLNRCLDELAGTENVQDPRNIHEFTLFDNLHWCPICEKRWTRSSVTHSEKTLHIKRCMKKKGITTQEMISIVRCLLSGNQTPMPSCADRVSRITCRQKYRISRNYSATLCEDIDEDFRTDTIIHSYLTTHGASSSKTTSNNPYDEDLQLALAISSSLSANTVSKRRATNRDPGATGILTAEEAQELIQTNATAVLFPIEEPSQAPDTPSFPRTRLAAIHSINKSGSTRRITGLSLWELTGTGD